MNKLTVAIEPLRSSFFSRVSWYVLCASFFLLATGCGTVQPNTPDELILARVNGEPITGALVESAFIETHQGHTAFLAAEGVIQEIIQKVVDKQLLLQEAKRVGFDRNPEIEQSVEKLRATRAAEQLYRDQVTAKVVISDEALAEAHKQAGDRFLARHILVESREAAEEAVSRVRAGADFGELAVNISQAKTAARGGYLGLVRFGQLEPELEEHLWRLQPGEISEPFETSDGWNILYVNERQSAAEPPALAKVRPQLTSILTKRLTKQRQDTIYRELESRWKPQIDETALRDFAAARDKRTLPSAVPLVTIGDDKVTIGQILPRMDFDKMQKLADPVAERAIRNLLYADILAILLRKEALAQGYGKKPEIAKEAETLRNKRAVELLLERVAFANLAVSDEEAQEYWRNHSETFSEPEAVKLSVIFIKSESAAQQLLSELRGGADFAVSARKMSEHGPSADLGGDLGWVVKGRLQPELEKTAFALKAGELGIAKLDAGYMVIRVDGNRAKRMKPFAEAKEQANHLALQEKARLRLKSWVTKLRQASTIEIDDAAISRATSLYQEKFRQKADHTKG